MAIIFAGHPSPTLGPKVAQSCDTTTVLRRKPSSSHQETLAAKLNKKSTRLTKQPPLSQAIPSNTQEVNHFDHGGRRERTPRHVPIIITETLVNSVLNKLPHSPVSPDSEKRSSGTFNSLPKKQPAPRPRHIPIVIPDFAQPDSRLPPTPQSSREGSRSSSLAALSRNPYSCKTIVAQPDFCQITTVKMSRPATSGSRASTIDSTMSGASPGQVSTNRFQPSSGTYLADTNSSHSSLNQVGPDGTQPVELPTHSMRPTEARPAETILHAGITSPPGGHQLQGNNGATNLSGLVCNVHRCTGKEPHALVGATTTILGDKLYVFGGRVLSRRRPQLTSDLYELDLIRKHWTKVVAIGDIPPPRYFHSMCTLGDTKLICYGGMSSAPPTASPQVQQASQEPQPDIGVMSDLHIYDATTRTWTEIKTSETPQGRYAHCAAVLPSTSVFTSTNAVHSAMHHNPGSENPNQGSIGISLDGSGGAEMVVVGGQDSANHYIEQISVFNLRSLKWTSTQTLGRSCGAYRSVIAPLKHMAASTIGSKPQGAEGVENTIKAAEENKEGPSMLIYSNYNFLDVKLELQIRHMDGSLTEKPMNSQFSPPGLRFPNGGVLANHFVVSGTYLTSSKQEYALWALDLRTLTWSRIDAGGGVFGQGSWNRGVVWPRRNTFVILGNRRRSLVEDYNHRRINFSNVCMVELEAFGLHDNPHRTNPTSSFPSVSAPIVPPLLAPKANPPSSHGPFSNTAIDLGEKVMDIRELCDMDLLAISGERLPVNSHLLARRWGPYFIQLMRESASTSGDLSSRQSNYHSTDSNPNSEAGTLRPVISAAQSIASRNSSITITPSINTMNSMGTDRTLGPPPSISSGAATTIVAPSIPLEPPSPNTLPADKRPRTLYLPHTILTLRALVRFLYTAALPLPGHSLCTPQILCSLLQIARPYRVDGLLEAVVERLHQVLDGRNAAAVFNAAAMAAGGGHGTGAIFGDEELERYGAGQQQSRLTNGLVTNGERRRSTSHAATTSNNHMRNFSGSTRVDEPAENNDSSPRSSISASTDASSASSAPSGGAGGEGSQASLGSDNSGSGGRRNEQSGHHHGGVVNHGSGGARAGAATDITTNKADKDEEIWSGGVSCVLGLQKRGLRGLMEGRRARERRGGGGGGGGGVGGENGPVGVGNSSRSQAAGGGGAAGGGTAAAAVGLGLGIV